MWKTELLERLNAGWALPNAVRDALPPGMPSRLEAGADLLMRAMSMPDEALPEGSQHPTRVGPTQVRLGAIVLAVSEADEELSVMVRPARAGAGGDVYPLATFVGQTLLLRSRGHQDVVQSWLAAGFGV